MGLTQLELLVYSCAARLGYRFSTCCCKYLLNILGLSVGLASLRSETVTYLDFSFCKIF